MVYNVLKELQCIGTYDLLIAVIILQIFQILASYTSAGQGGFIIGTTMFNLEESHIKI